MGLSNIADGDSKVLNRVAEDAVKQRLQLF
jgi:hypothetical protein